MEVLSASAVRLLQEKLMVIRLKIFNFKKKYFQKNAYKNVCVFVLKSKKSTFFSYFAIFFAIFCIFLLIIKKLFNFFLLIDEQFFEQCETLDGV